MTHNQSLMLDALHAEGPAADRADRMMLYGQFVGSWDGTLAYQDAEGVRRETSAEVHFDWALEGRAVQDVWISPARHTRTVTERPLMYGTTLRVYDPDNDLWHITWIDPVRQAFNRMTGNQVGNDIVQEYRASDGTLCQWLFTEISAGSFHWTNRESKDEGKSWKVRGEFFLRRRASGIL